MDQSNESFQKRWENHIEKLIKISAKKIGAVEAKHQQIVEGACKVFFRKGFHPTSMREIADSADMSLGQMYHYISSKDDVLFLIHKHMQTLWYQRLMDTNIEESADPSRKLELTLRESLSFLAEHKDLIQFIYSESKYLCKEHLRVVLEMDSQNVAGYWRKNVQNALLQQGVAKDVELGGNLVAFIMVFLSLRGWNLKSRSVDESIEFIIDFIFDGLSLKRPSKR
jgi:AcrR family transcriptional regulator